MVETEPISKSEVLSDIPWGVVVHDDPVNLTSYVTWVLMKVLSHPKAKAEALMWEVHRLGRSVVWTGNREMAELYAQQLQGYQLRTTVEKAGE
ncbi:ATP-dependent Clp protease adaptor protein ClpS [Haloferula luteola]|uniref:ATP-dependent Clp protease adaptor protein ClpS n=1 Tax=Haloferula luteola TaxID=595692 RepID=A0A840V798_9BACT|nr:ATP-dependent Clp protease adaptor ClpS [Haloferula luteola]MBB5352916.1 ATP-dependent Clp protease adaptor protein ClpS [Haloferula luteola]